MVELLLRPIVTNSHEFDEKVNSFSSNLDSPSIFMFKYTSDSFVVQLITIGLPQIDIMNFLKSINFSLIRKKRVSEFKLSI